MWMYAIVIAIALSAGAGVYLSQNTDVAMRDTARMEEPQVHAISANNIARYLRRMMMDDPSMFPAVPASGQVAISNALIAMAMTNSGIQIPQGVSYFLLSTGDIVPVYVRNTANNTLDDDMLDQPFNRVVQLDGANPFLFDRRDGPIDREMPEFDPVTVTAFDVTDDDPSTNWFRGGNEGSTYDDEDGSGTGTDVTDPVDPGDPPVGDPVVVPDDEPYDSGTDEGEFGGVQVGDGSDVTDDGEFAEEGYNVQEEVFDGETESIVTNINIASGYETIDGPFASFVDPEILFDFYSTTVSDSYAQTPRTNDDEEHKFNLQRVGNSMLVPIRYQLINQLAVDRQEAEDMFMRQCDTMNRIFLTDNTIVNGVGVEDEMEAVFNGANALWEDFASDQECQDDDECRVKFAMSTSTAEEIELATTSLLISAAYCESVHKERREGLPTRAHRGHPDNAVALIQSARWLQDYKDRTWWLNDEYVGANLFTSRYREQIDTAINMYNNVANYPVPTTENTVLFTDEEEDTSGTNGGTGDNPGGTSGN